MTAGRNMLTRYARVYVGGYDLSGDHRDFGSLINKCAHVDNSGIDDDFIHYLADRREVGITGYKALLDDATGKSVTALQSLPAVAAVTVALGNGAAPIAGDLAYMLPAVQMGDIVSPEGGIYVVQADFEMDYGDYANYSPMGYIILPLTAISASGNSSTWNGGAAGTNGYLAVLHITVSGPGSYAFALEESTTGAFAGEQDTLFTFTATGSTITSEVKSGSGNVKQYRRLKYTKTSGTCSAFCAMVVN